MTPRGGAPQGAGSSAAVRQGTAPSGKAAPAGQSAQRPWGELVLVALLAVLAFALLLGTGRITVPGSSNTIGPRFFPYLVGGLLVVATVAVGVLVARGRPAPSEDSEDVDAGASTSWAAVGVIAAAFAAHAMLINVVGWPLAVSLMFMTVAKALGARGWARPFLVGGIASVLVWLVFVKALGVALPGGVLLEQVTGG